jgi:hypothetical protein
MATGDGEDRPGPRGDEKGSTVIMITNHYIGPEAAVTSDDDAGRGA